MQSELAAAQALAYGVEQRHGDIDAVMRSALEALPGELLLEVASSLSPLTLGRLSSTSYELRNAFLDARLWNALLRQDYPMLEEQRPLLEQAVRRMPRAPSANALKQLPLEIDGRVHPKLLYEYLARNELALLQLRLGEPRIQWSGVSSPS